MSTVVTTAARRRSATAHGAAGLRQALGVIAGVVMVVVGVVGVDAGARTSLAFGTDPGAGDWLLTFPTRPVAVVAGLMMLVQALVPRSHLDGRRSRVLVVAGGYVATLCWLLSALLPDRQMSVVGLAQASLLLALPIVFGALGGVICERSGVINIALEGQLLAGAFVAAVATSLAGSAYVGLLLAAAAGAGVSALLVLFAVRYLVDQIIVGVVLNVLVVGLTNFLHGRFLVPDADTYNSPVILDPVAIPVLADVPVLGPVLFEQNILVYGMYVAVAATHIALRQTRWGLRVRSVGEHPEASESVGVDVLKTRARAVLLGGAVAGLGGAAFTIGSVGAFGPEMTAGKGFIALAAVILGRWTPLGALGAALFFGFADSYQSVLSITGSPVPSEFMLMVPYVATILAVAGLVGRVRAPAADGKPFKKQH